MSVIDQIKERLDIVSLISDYIPLRKAGRNFIGFCPFHSNTRTPAFTVFPETQSYHCFSCKKSGDIFAFLMEREALDFGETLQRLGVRSGVEVRPRSQMEEQQDAQRTRLVDLHLLATTFYANLLRSAPRAAAARDYVASRGLTQDSVETFQLGYAPADWSALLSYLSERGFEPAEIEQAGLAIRRDDGGYHDRFRDRLLFPIADAKGQVVGFGGRLLGEGHPKYLNSPQTPIFDKGSLLYGFHMAREAIRREQSVVVVEGYVDVIMAHQAGYKNVVAPMGTALSDSHVRALNKLTKRLFMALDADAAGQAATLKGLQTLQENLETRTVPVPTAEGLRWERELDAEIRIVAMPSGKDPDEVIRDNPAEWQRLVDASLPLMDFYLRALTADLDLHSAKGKATAVERIGPLLAQVGDRIEQAHYIQQLATLVGLDEAIVRSTVRPNRPSRSAPQPTLPAAPISDREREDYLLALLLRYPAHHAALEQHLNAEIAQAEHLNLLMEGRIAELFESTENRQLWHAYEQALASGGAQDGTWMANLPPELFAHVEQLLRRHNAPALPPYRINGELFACVLPLRVRLARRWNRQLVQVIQAATPEERTGLLASQSELQNYLHRLSLPPRSSYFRDTRDLAGL